MADDLADAIADAAQAPAEMSTDGTTAKAVSIPDMILADQYAKGAAAAAQTNDQGGPRSGWSMCRPARIVPPGGV